MSTWRGAGVPSAQVAESAGRSDAVLLRVYAKAMTGQGDDAKRRIAAVLWWAWWVAFRERVRARLAARPRHGAHAHTGGLPLAGRPYDLRHSGVTLALTAGVPAPEGARRAGHGVDVLLRVCAGCIDGHEHMWNGRIEDALKDGD